MNVATVGTSKVKAPLPGFWIEEVFRGIFVFVSVGHVRAKPYDDIDVGDDFVLPEGRVWLHF